MISDHGGDDELFGPPVYLFLRWSSFLCTVGTFSFRHYTLRLDSSSLRRTSSRYASSVSYNGLPISLTTSAILLYVSVGLEALPCIKLESRPTASSYCPISALTANVTAALLAVAMTSSKFLASSSDRLSVAQLMSCS